jgi:hypothetical protein
VQWAVGSKTVGSKDVLARRQNAYCLLPPAYCPLPAGILYSVSGVQETVGPGAG